VKPKYETHGLDTQTQVLFYEQDFYVLSNFSAFSIVVDDIRFDNVEGAYHWKKFKWTQAQRLACTDTNIINQAEQVAYEIRNAISAHEAFQIAQRNKHLYRPDWDTVKFDVMRDLLWLKVIRHEYVRRKLIQTGDRILIENSWRDNVWGWGPNMDGQNRLGKLWMEIRDTITSFRALIVCRETGQMSAAQWYKHLYDTPWLKEYAEAVNG